MKEVYTHKRFHGASQVLIVQANKIIEEYQAQGYSLTLRQLYYQFVARGLIENSVKSYKKLGVVVSDARLAGLIDWAAIEDRTRVPKGNGHWDDPEAILQASAYSFALDKWANQPNHVEVWIEKEALAGVLASVCPDLDVSYFSCRGYVSQSAQWRAAKRLQGYLEAGQRVHVLHLGDHDPSGIDMTRDILDRFSTFRTRVTINRLALNMDQVEQYGPPPNPAKLTDSRAVKYVEEYGPSSWELDALEPKVITSLVEDNVLALRDEGQWLKMVNLEEQYRASLTSLASQYAESHQDY